MSPLSAVDVQKRHQKRDTKTVVSFKPPLAKCLYFWSLFTVCSIVFISFPRVLFPFISLIYSRPSISWMFAVSIKCHIKCHKIVRWDVLFIQEVGDQWQKKAKVKRKQNTGPIGLLWFDNMSERPQPISVQTTHARSSNIDQVSAQHK